MAAVMDYHKKVCHKITLQRLDLKTTHTHLGKVIEHEAIQWMDILHGK